jgi:hypothetical protein
VARSPVPAIQAAKKRARMSLSLAKSQTNELLSLGFNQDAGEPAAAGAAAASPPPPPPK